MKKKVTKRKAVKKRSVKRSQSSWTGMVLGALLVVGLGWWVYKANTQSVDINLVADRASRERVMERWTFDTAADFGPSGVWRTPVSGLAPTLKDGAVVWDNTRSSVQIVAPGLNLDFNEPINGKYVIKVKADMVQADLTSSPRPNARQVKPKVSPTPAPSQFRIVVLLYSVPFEVDGVRRLLGSQEVIANLSDDMKEYEFAFDNIESKRHVQLMRLFFVYPPEHSQNITAAYQVYRGLSVKVDEVTVLRRVNEFTYDKRSPTTPTYQQKTNSTGR